VQEADIAAGPIVITSTRARVVDFTHAFMLMEASLLMSRATQRKYNYATTVRDIVERTEVRLGTLNRGVIHRTLRKSNDTLYRRMYEAMTLGRGDSQRADSEGQKRVQR